MTARVLLVSTYEQGHQPLHLAAPAAVLRDAGHDVDTLDLAVDSPEAERFLDADLIAVSVPMHTAARLAVELARRVRRLRPDVHLACYGLYASPLHEAFGGVFDTAIGGEYEPTLLALADHLGSGGDQRFATPSGVGATPYLGRQSYPTPDRSGLPPLRHYAHVDRGHDRLGLVGYVEASRGCAHTCTHCPITPVYGGRLRTVQAETVLADIDQLVAAGAEHLTFGDPDFLNGVRHSLGIARSLHERYPEVTFDATIKVEHLVEHERHLEELRDLGCLFITSAFESTSDRILDRLQKGHHADDLDHVLATAQRLGLTIRPTWVAFTPWTRRADFLGMLDFIEERGLVRHVQPVQYALRLLLPPGSPLIAALAAEQRLGPYDHERLTYTWSDAEIDPLQQRVTATVEAAAAQHEHASEDPVETFRRVKAIALDRNPGATKVAPQPSTFVPGLTEAWFC